MFKINRRTFLGLFKGLAPVLVIGPVDPAVAEPQALPVKPSYRKVYLDEVAIAGFRYYDGMRAEVATSLCVGQTLVLRRQSENPYDAKAIEVITEAGMKLGYLPRSANLTPAALADQSVPLGAEISALDLDAQPWQRARVRVYQLIADVPPPPQDSIDHASGPLNPPFAAAPIDPESMLRVNLNAAVAERRAWFERYFQDVAANLRPAPPDGKRDVCPCCGYPAAFPVCLLCHWKNDGATDEYDPDGLYYGANPEGALIEARVHFYNRLTGLETDTLSNERNGARKIVSAKRAAVVAYERMRGVTDDFVVRALWHEVYQQEANLKVSR